MPTKGDLIPFNTSNNKHPVFQISSDGFASCEPEKEADQFLNY